MKWNHAKQRDFQSFDIGDYDLSTGIFAYFGYTRFHFLGNGASDSPIFEVIQACGSSWSLYRRELGMWCTLVLLYEYYIHTWNASTPFQTLVKDFRQVICDRFSRCKFMITYTRVGEVRWMDWLLVWFRMVGGEVFDQLPDGWIMQAHMPESGGR